MNTSEALEHKIQRSARTMRVVQADANGKLPTKIEVLKAGTWDTPYHGIFEIHVADMEEMVANFDAGVSMAGGSIEEGGVGLPIDFGHESAEEAAGWIKRLWVEGTSLYAEVEWTAAGTEALMGGNYKCFSPEFYPKSRGGWPDPERYDVYIPNVLVGGGLTNIPLFKGLKPVMASADTGTVDKRNIIYVSESKGVNMPTLEDIVAKNVDQLTEEEKTFLAENKASLTDEQKQKFGFEVAAPAPAEPAAPVAPVAEAPAQTAPVADAEAMAIAASVKSGELVAIKASELSGLREMERDYRLEKATKVVAAHAKRGAIKADQVGAWAERLSKDASVEELLKGLPDNQIVASAMGASTRAADAKSAIETIKEKAKEAIKASADTGKALTMAEAYSQVMKADPELAQRYEEEQRTV